MRVLENIQPADVFKYFEEISNIPRGSGNKEKRFLHLPHTV